MKIIECSTSAELRAAIKQDGVNVPELFKPEHYWSCEQHASYSDSAWFQNFLNGSQYYWYKYYLFRARVVRSVPIQ